MGYKQKVDVVAAILSDEGWTCEYHEPDSKCPVCQRLHKRTAGRILSALGFGLVTPPDSVQETTE